MNRHAIALSTLSAALLTGCTTIGTDQPGSGLPDPADVMQERLTRVEEKLSGIQMEQARLAREIDRIQRGQESAASGAPTMAQLQALERHIQAVDAAREADRKALYDQLSRRIAEILNATPSPAPGPAPSPSPGGGAAAGGRSGEHVVKAGETLSRIATQYHTSVPAILKANGLPDANSIRVGQKLAIPK